MINNDLQDAIKRKDINEIKAILIGYIDSGSQEILKISDEVNSELERYSMNLFDKDNDRMSFKNEEKNAETLTKIKATLRSNFSREKLEFAEKIIRKIGISKFETDLSTPGTQSASNESSQNKIHIEEYNPGPVERFLSKIGRKIDRLIDL